MPSPYSIVLFPVVNFTLTGQTSAAIPLGTTQANGQWTSGSWSAAAISLSGVALTTATFGLLGSADGGVTFNAIAMESAAAPGTYATTFTATGPGIYCANLAGLTHVQFVTSGTFTGTSIALVMAASPNAQVGVRGPAGAAGGSALVVGTTTISGGVSGRVEYNNAGVLGELPVAGAGAGLTTGPTSGVTPGDLALFTGTGGQITDGAIAGSSVVTLTGSQTLTNKALTAPVITGGTIDNAVIGGTTPAAGTFSSLKDTGLISAAAVATDGSGNLIAATLLPRVVASVNLTAQAANIGATTAYTTAAAGWYRVTAQIIITQIASTSSVLPNATATFTDSITSVANVVAVAIGGSSTANTLGKTTTNTNVGAASNQSFYAANASLIQYSTNTYTSVGATPMQYALHFLIEYLGT